MTVPLPNQIKVAPKQPTPPSTKPVEPESKPSQSKKPASDRSTSKKMVWGKRPSHLMDRPLKDHPGLKALQTAMEPSKPRRPRRAQRA